MPGGAFLVILGGGKADPLLMLAGVADEVQAGGLLGVEPTGGEKERNELPHVGASWEIYV